MPQSPLYDSDFYGWAKEQAALLRAGKLEAVDIENIAEEIESLSRGEKRELVNRLEALLLQLLKWRFRPDLRGASLEATVKLERIRLVRHMTESPSLKEAITEAARHAYEVAIIQAAADLERDEAWLRTEAAWTFEQLSDLAFWPADSAEAPSHREEA